MSSPVSIAAVVGWFTSARWDEVSSLVTAAAVVGLFMSAGWGATTERKDAAPFEDRRFFSSSPETRGSV